MMWRGISSGISDATRYELNENILPAIKTKP
jgi:hypothetical protein